MAKVSLTDLIKYIGDRSRPLIEGEAAFKAGHIIMCGLLNSNEIKIKSLCLQTSSLNSPPHEIVLDLCDDVEKWNCKCSCKAGQSGYCKHIIATLIYINRHEDLEQLSCTDLTQVWGKEKKGVTEKYSKGTPVSEFCYGKKRKVKPYESTAEIDRENFKDLVNCRSTSAIYKIKTIKRRPPTCSHRCTQVVVFYTAPSSLGNFFKNYYTFLLLRFFFCFCFFICCSSTSAGLHEQDKLFEMILENANNCQFLDTIDLNINFITLDDCCKEVLKRLAEYDQMQIAKECIQKSDFWKAERNLRITGSRVYSIFTFSKFDSWGKKACDYFSDKQFYSKYTAHGIQYEPEALENYKMQTNFEVLKPEFIICKKFPWLGYSPDGIVVQNGKPSILIEIKCPYAGVSQSHASFVNTCDFLKENNGVVALKKKHRIYGQVQLGMALLNLSLTHLIVYSPFSKSYLNVEVPFDAVFAKELIECVSKKYFQNMIHVVCKNNKA